MAIDKKSSHTKHASSYAFVGAAYYCSKLPMSSLHCFVYMLCQSASLTEWLCSCLS
jgi:hypothetical protein